ncbi:hypothetical protein MMC20_006812 [Loxospora ochrophaea]|nr:hypothetical protein [Loxospora ochrophaea]
MASTDASPLRSFSRLSTSTFIRPPPLNSSITPSQNAGSGSAPPDTIILSAWNNAAQRHMSKYISGYTTLYPNARLLLLTTTTPDLVYRTTSSQNATLSPVVDALCAQPNDRLLIHCFSNGGAYKFTELCTAYRNTTGNVLPIRAMILDSGPDNGRSFKRSLAAVVQGLPKQWHLRIPGMFIAYILVGVVWLRSFFNQKSAIEKMYKNLNEPKVIDINARRCYVYSQADDMVWWKEIEAHSQDAEAKGWKTAKEKFEGSMHVGHVRLDGQRYWKIVTDTWENS